jgi:hypothetical protein
MHVTFGRELSKTVCCATAAMSLEFGTTRAGRKSRRALAAYIRTAGGQELCALGPGIFNSCFPKEAASVGQRETGCVATRSIQLHASLLVWSTFG